MSQSPTIGRIVLVRVAYNTGVAKRPVDVPAIITEVHSALCVSVVALSAFEVEWNGTKFRGAQPLTSLSLQDEDCDIQDGRWRWMPIQQAGGGFDARISALEKANELRSLMLGTESAGPAQPKHQPSIFESQAQIEQAKAPSEVDALRSQLNADRDVLCQMMKRVSVLEADLEATASNIGKLHELVSAPAQIAADSIKVTPAGLELGGATVATGVEVNLQPGSPIPADSDPNAAH